MTTLANRPNTALLVVDVQNGVVAERLIERGSSGLQYRQPGRAGAERGVPVVWVQHDRPGTHLKRGSDVWQIVLGTDARLASEPRRRKELPRLFRERPTLESSALRVSESDDWSSTGAQTDACVRSTHARGSVREGTTRCWSAMPTRPENQTCLWRTATRIRSSPTRICIGSTRRRRDGRLGRSKRRTSTSAPRPRGSASGVIRERSPRRLSTPQRVKRHLQREPPAGRPPNSRRDTSATVTM